MLVKGYTNKSFAALLDYAVWQLHYNMNNFTGINRFKSYMMVLVENNKLCQKNLMDRYNKCPNDIRITRKRNA